MIRTLLISFLSVLFSGAIHAQSPAIQWQKFYGGSGFDGLTGIRQTTDGGYVIAGSSTSTNGDVTGNHGGTSDYWIVKTSANGTLQWEKSLGGTNEEQLSCIRQTTDGGYIVAGYTTSTDGDVTGNHGDLDFWIVKLTSTGNIAWQKTLGGSKADAASSVAQTTDGGYIVAGSTTSNDGDVTGFHVPPDPAYSDYWVVKLSATGNIQWEHCFGGTGYEEAEAVCQTTDGGYFVAGTQNTDPTGTGIGVCLGIKLSATGDLQWQKTYGGTTGATLLVSAQQTADGGYMLAGNTRAGDISGFHGADDIWIIKTNTTGDIQWQKCLGGSDADDLFMACQTADGGYLTAGVTTSHDGDVYGNHAGYDAWITKLSPAGTMVWQKPIGGSGDDGAMAIQQTADMGYVIGGYAQSHDGDIAGPTVTGSGHYWVAKLGGVNAVDDIINHTSVSISPNPTTGEINISGAGMVTIRLYNTMGQLVREAINTNTLSVSDLPNALYFVKLLNEAGEVVYNGEISKI